jgi:hypothetical protein
MTAKQKELIADNLRAFINNFGDVRIEKESYGKGFYVFYPANTDSYIQYCYDINYLNGWLYGVVQGAVRGEFKQYRTGVERPLQERRYES